MKDPRERAGEAGTSENLIIFNCDINNFSLQPTNKVTEF
jgi:hypothetical protein